MENPFPEGAIYFPEHPDNVSYKVTWTGKVLYRLRDPFVYVWEKDGIERAIVVKEGFLNDGASVPRLIQTIGGLHQDSVRPAAIIHDLIYAHKGAFPNNDGGYFRKDRGEWRELAVNIPRKTADKLFARIMREMGFPVHLRRRAYRAVRLGGWTGW